MTVVNGHTCLAEQSQLKKLGIEPDTKLERFDQEWKSVTWREMFTVCEEEKVYLRGVEVSYGWGMPQPDIIEI